MEETRSVQINLNVTPETKSRLEAIARRDYVSRATVIRKAIREMLENEPQHCPECNGTEIERRDVHQGAHVVEQARCADCRTEVEV